jgi:transposase
VYAFAVYLTQYPFLPYQRTAELFDELAGIALSPATVHAAVISWAAPMIGLLCEAKEAADHARDQGLAALPAPTLEQFQARYDELLTQGEGLNPRHTQRTGTRGRIKQSSAYNLLGRLRERRDDTLRFLTDLRVPFDNNQAERDVRMPKVKQKVSGGFRSSEGAAAFATLRSYLSTLRKQSADLFQALVLTFQGAPPMPRLG